MHGHSDTKRAPKRGGLSQAHLPLMTGQNGDKADSVADSSDRSEEDILSSLSQRRVIGHWKIEAQCMS